MQQVDIDETDLILSDQKPYTGTPQWAPVWALAIVGLLPIVVFTLLLIFAGRQSAIAAPITDAYKTFAAIILSFLGGVHWGVALNGSSHGVPRRTFVLAILAPLFGWIALFVSEPLSFALLIVIFAGQGAWDNFAGHSGQLPYWYARMRMILTIMMVVSLAIVMFVVN